MRSNSSSLRDRYPNGFILFVWQGTCNFCDKNENNWLSLKDDIARTSAKIILDLGKIIWLGRENNFQVILLEIPIFCIQEWNRVHGYPSPEDFRQQDKDLQRDIHLVNEEIRRLNLDSGTVTPIFNVDLK